MTKMDYFNYGGDKYDLSSERWRKPHFFQGRTDHSHVLDLKDISVPIPFYYNISTEHCMFCQADSTFDRTLGEILYHLTKYTEGHPKVNEILISKWKNNVDAWDNPIGNNIKG